MTDTAALTSLFGLDGKTALVTGGSRGIGYMAAKGLLDAGARVYIVARKAHQVEDAVQRLGVGDQVIGLSADLSSAESCREFAAQIAERAPSVCLIGDGGMQFTLPELASAVEAQVPLIVLLWNNQGYEEIKKYMVNRAIEPVGVDIYTPDFIGVARALGGEAEEVGDVAQLQAALQRAVERRGPTLIQVDQRQWQEAVPG